MNQSRKALNFDLSESKLKEFYPSKSKKGYKKAWTDINKFMMKNQFIHTQYSGYESCYQISYYEAFAIIEELQSNYPWFHECLKVATLTEISKQYDVLKYLDSL